MANPVLVVTRQLQGENDAEVPCGRGLWVWCPGCDEAHRPRVVGEDGSLPPGPCWEWDGNVEAPTISPSLLTASVRGRRCHSFIRAGVWEFLPDCGHALAGQQVPMVPVPDWVAEFGE